MTTLTGSSLLNDKITINRYEFEVVKIHLKKFLEAFESLNKFNEIENNQNSQCNDGNCDSENNDDGENCANDQEYDTGKNHNNDEDDEHCENESLNSDLENSKIEVELNETTNETSIKTSKESSNENNEEIPEESFDKIPISGGSRIYNEDDFEAMESEVYSRYEEESSDDAVEDQTTINRPLNLNQSTVIIQDSEIKLEETSFHPQNEELHIKNENLIDFEPLNQQNNELINYDTDCEIVELSDDSDDLREVLRQFEVISKKIIGEKDFGGNIKSEKEDSDGSCEKLCYNGLNNVVKDSSHTIEESEPKRESVKSKSNPNQPKTNEDPVEVTKNFSEASNDSLETTLAQFEVIENLEGMNNNLNEDPNNLPIFPSLPVMSESSLRDPKVGLLPPSTVVATSQQNSNNNNIYTPSQTDPASNLNQHFSDSNKNSSNLQCKNTVNNSTKRNVSKRKGDEKNEPVRKKLKTGSGKDQNTKAKIQGYPEKIGSIKNTYSKKDPCLNNNNQILSQNDINQPLSKDLENNLTAHIVRKPNSTVQTPSRINKEAHSTQMPSHQPQTSQQTHITTQIINEKIYRIKCNKCNLIIPIGMLQQHDSHHQQNLIPNSNIPLKMATESNLKQSENNSNIYSLQNFINKFEKCEICKSLVSKHSMEAHKMCHQVKNNEFVIKCRYCEFKSSNLNVIRHHIKNTNDEAHFTKSISYIVLKKD